MLRGALFAVLLVLAACGSGAEPPQAAEDDPDWFSSVQACSAGLWTAAASANEGSALRLLDTPSLGPEHTSVCEALLNCYWEETGSLDLASSQERALKDCYDLALSQLG